ncbi:MAG: DNA-protecting protein DprA [Candidatus Omnitrophica bacterium]|nr:DNA-protecting protein DprA [Candidatus Omnitrophota bacterium]
MIPESLKALLALNRLNGFGIQTLKTCWDRAGSAESVLRACLAGKLPFKSSKADVWRAEAERILAEGEPEKEFRACAESGVQILGFKEPGYPAALYDIYDPPLILYVRGDLAAGDRCCLAIVGTRGPSAYGIETARRFASFFAQAGITVVSGFAKGIDSEAHRGALLAKGRTVAVLGCGVDQIYPAENKALYEDFLNQGAFVSEYPLGTLPQAVHFPRRNRIISGLCLGVLIVEAHERSGSLITAQFALEQGREVFAVPGRIDSLRSRGTNRLIREGAALVESPEDVISELAPALKASLRGAAVLETAPETPEADPILKACRQTPLTFDELVQKTALPAAELPGRLTGLELEKKLTRMADGRFLAAQKS